MNHPYGNLKTLQGRSIWDWRILWYELMILVIKSHPLVAFFVLAYGLSWGNFVLSRAWPDIPFLFPYGPMLAAITVASITCGGAGLEDILWRCLRWRVGLRWYAAALFVPVAIALAMVSFDVLLGGGKFSLERIGLDQISWYSLILLFPVAMIDAPLGEESGWRGYALPRFPASRSPLENTLILGVLQGRLASADRPVREFNRCALSDRGCRFGSCDKLGIL